MEIRRIASRRSGAEPFTLVPEQVPRVTRDPVSGRLVLRALNVPSPRDEGSQFDTEVYLTQSDIDLLLSQLSMAGPGAEPHYGLIDLNEKNDS